MPDPSLHLNLWKQRLGQVPDWVWERTNLETLVLADNDLCEISPSIGSLRALRILDFGRNQFVSRRIKWTWYGKLTIGVQ